MNVQEAKTLVAALTAAIHVAEKAGSTEIDLQARLQALDDQARGELQAAIDAAAKHGG